MLVIKQLGLKSFKLASRYTELNCHQFNQNDNKTSTDQETIIQLRAGINLFHSAHEQKLMKLMCEYAAQDNTTI